MDKEKNYRIAITVGILICLFAIFTGALYNWIYLFYIIPGTGAIALGWNKLQQRQKSNFHTTG